MNSNGLNTFEFHADEDQAAFNTLRAERATTSLFALTNAAGLSLLEPETTARQHLQLALDDEPYKGFKAWW